MSSSVRRLVGRALLLPVAAALALGACGDDDDDASTGETTTTTADQQAEADADAAAEAEGMTHDEASREELMEWQADLDAVGCWSGEPDGELGPHTEAAIKQFQHAAGLDVDGVLGPRTKSALEADAAAGAQVCTGGAVGSDDPDAVPTGDTMTLSAAGYNKVFSVTSCENPTESTVTVAGSSGAQTLNVTVTNGTGTVAVAGGNEQDGITLNGTASRTLVGDTGIVTIQGTFAAPNLSGETFTLTGQCL